MLPLRLRPAEDEVVNGAEIMDDEDAGVMIPLPSVITEDTAALPPPPLLPGLAADCSSRLLILVGEIGFALLASNELRRDPEEPA